MEKIILRDYQKKVQVNASKLFYNGSKSQLWCMPAGSGKTFTAGDTIKKMVEQGKKVAFFCHKNDLIVQSYNSFKKLGIDAGVISSPFPELENLFAKVQVISIPTFNARFDKLPYFDFDYIFFDECHHLGSKSWVSIYNHFTEKGARVIGLTATPCRLDGKPLGNYFFDMVSGPTVRDLITEGSLSDYDYYIPTTINLSNIKKTGGDYNQKQVKDAFGKSKIMGDIPKQWLSKCKGMKTIAFAPNIEQGKEILRECQSFGIRCAWLDANSGQNQRASVIRDFANGNIDILWNVNLFSEGFDLSAQVGIDVPIEAVLLCRPTASLSLYIQQVTRALRKKTTKAVVLDFVDNASRHGFPCWDRDWSLDKKVKSRAEQNIDEAGVAVVTCKECYRAYEPRYKKCPFCDTERTKTTKEYEIEKQHELEKADIKQKEDKKSLKKLFIQELLKCKTQEQAINVYKKAYGVGNDYKARYHLSMAYRRIWEKLL